MLQNIEEDNILQLQLLYYIHTEIIQSEEINKILLNQSIQNWDQLISQDHNVNIIGLYGTEQTVCEYLEKRLCNKIKLSDDAIMHQNQSMICFINHESTYYIAFIGQEDQFTKDYFEENIDLSLFRYLKDLCSQIILLPSKEILDRWKTLEQVFNSQKASVLQEYRIQDIQNDHIQCSPIELRIDKQHILMATKLLNGQENIRSFYSKKKQNFDFLEKDIFEKIFRKLWQGYQVSQIDFLNEYTSNIQQILQKSSTNIQEQIQSKREKKYLKCLKECNHDNIFSKQYGIQNISKILFKAIWDNMPISTQLVYSTKIKNIIIKQIQDEIPNQFKNFQNNSNFEQIVNKIYLCITTFLQIKKKKKLNDN